MLILQCGWVFSLDVELGSQKNRHDSVLDEHFEPVTLTWRNVNVYTVPNKGGCCNRGQEKSPRKQILKDGKSLLEYIKSLAKVKFFKSRKWKPVISKIDLDLND